MHLNQSSAYVLLYVYQTCLSDTEALRLGEFLLFNSKLETDM